MPTLTIPAESVPALVKLAVLPDETMKALIDALRSEATALSLEHLTQRIAPSVELPENDIKLILGLLMSLYSAHKQTEMAASEVATAAISHLPEGTTAPDGLVENLTELLSLDVQFEITSKALSVMIEQQRAFVSARIMTDMRPVYAGDDPLTAAVVTHTLRIGYRESREYREVFVALDSADLNQLRALIDRAVDKEARLKAACENIRFLDP